MNLTEQIIRNGPNSTVGFIASPDNVSAILESVVALLNSGGGYIIVGADDTGHVVGVADANQAAVDLQTQLVQAISPKAFLDVGVDTAAGQQVLTVVVPGGKDLPFVAEGRSFLRRGTASVPASGSELQAMLQKRVAEVERWERRISPTLEEEDLDPEEVAAGLRAVHQYWASLLPLTTADELLRALGMMQRGQFRNAADICLGKNPALRYPQVRVRCFAFQTDRSGDFIDQRTLAGPVVSVLEQAVTFIRERAPLAASFADNQLARTDAAAYPLSAVREGLVNALAHRDYASFSGGVTIEIYPTRMEVWNAGRLPLNWDAHKLRTTHPSLPANPDIAHYLYVRGYMERIGRGTLKMIQVYEEEGLPSPKWAADKDGVRLTLYSRIAEPTASEQLNQRQQTFLHNLNAGAVVSFTDYQRVAAADISERQARRDISKLVDLGLLRLEGKGRATQYVRTRRGLSKS